MAIYHFEAKIISRGAGRSAVAAAAYQSGEQLYNDYDGITHDYTKKGGVRFSEIILPPNAPPEWADRQTLWNAVEMAEKAKDSRLARQLIVALPGELTMQDWLPMLRRFVQEQCVKKGMCVDYAIHDTDGNNPHAHIMLTVRPLDINGRWQAKTQKEYLCRCGNEEKGFTAAEFQQAKNSGWEKQYQYQKSRRIVGWYTPSEATNHPEWVRASKQPKTTKYGRQNPVCALWNSENQILIWRESWADCVNRALAQKQCIDRVSHLSHVARGLTEQPTVHEGFTARNLEKTGIVADRCELNRQIKADNRLLCELKAVLKQLAEAAEYSVTRIAQTLETLRDKIVLAEYQLSYYGHRASDCQAAIRKVRPLLTEVCDIDEQIDHKTVERKAAQAEKQACGLLHPVRLHQLSGQIAALSEEIEELREQKAMRLSGTTSRQEISIKELAKRLQFYEQSLSKLTAQQKRLTCERDDGIAEFDAVCNRISPENMPAVLDRRIDIRHDHAIKLASRLRELFREQYYPYGLMNAESRADAALHEKVGEIATCSLSRLHNQQPIHRSRHAPDAER